MTNPLTLFKRTKGWRFSRQRSPTATSESPEGAMELRSTLSATPLDLASPLNQTIQTSPPSSPSTPNRIVALPLEYGSPPTTAAQPPQSSLSSLKRSLSTKGDTLKRSFSTSSSKVKENLVSIKGLKRTSSSGAYERLDPLSEAPEEDLGHWLCCQEQDDISPWPCKKKNDLSVSLCGRCGHWVCDQCEVIKEKKEKKELGTPAASLAGGML